MGFIYKITNDINDKIYIGQTTQTIEQRWKQHQYSAKYYKYELYNAINKYGIEHFKIEIVEECDNSELNTKEIYWIKKYNSYEKGYNMTLGGEVINSKKKPVVQIDPKTNEIIGIYESAREAERVLNIPNQYISQCCLGSRAQVSGYFWKFYNKEDYFEAQLKKQQKLIKKHRIVLCNEINKKFNCIADAAKFINSIYSEKTYSTIYNNIRRALIKNIKAYNYTWSYLS